MSLARFFSVSILALLASSARGLEPSSWEFQSLAGQIIALTVSDEEITQVIGHVRVTTNDCRTSDLLICFRTPEFLFALPKKKLFELNVTYQAAGFWITPAYRIDELSFFGEDVKKITVFYIHSTPELSNEPDSIFYYSDRNGLVAFYALSAHLRQPFVYTGALPGPFSNSFRYEME